MIDILDLALQIGSNTILIEKISRMDILLRMLRINYKICTIINEIQMKLIEKAIVKNGFEL